MSKADWVAIQHGAISDNSLTRKHFLVQAVTELEKALIASGVDLKKERKKHKPLADVLFDHLDKEDRLENGPSPARQRDTFRELLRGGIAARNKGVHWDTDVARLSVRCL